MEIYRKIVLNMQDWSVLEKDSYEYNGPIAECKGESSLFKSQQTGAYNQTSNFSQYYTNFFNDVNNMMAERFGRQSNTFNTLTQRLGKATRGGVGKYQFGGKDGQLGPAGGGAGGGRGAGGAGKNAPGSDLNAQLGLYGYDPGLYNVDWANTAKGLQPFYKGEEQALRAEASDQNASAFAGANQAFGQRAMQLGGYSPGLESAGLSAIEAEQAANEAAAQRAVTLQGAQNKREDLRTLWPLETQLALGQGDSLSKAAALRLQDAINRRSLKAASGAAGAARAQAAQQFAEQMKLRAAEFQSENFFKGIGAIGGLAGMQDPSGYGQMALGALAGGSNPWGNIYNNASQGMIQTRSSNMWGNILGGLAGGALNMFTGGLSGAFGGGGGLAQYNPLGGSQNYGLLAPASNPYMGTFNP